MTDNNPLVCYCLNVTRNEIIDAIKNNNADTLQKIKKITGATGGCSTCRMDVEEILEKTKAEVHRETKKIYLSKIPSNIYNLKNPLNATITYEKSIAMHDNIETKHIDIDIHDTSFEWVEGQSLGVIPPGTQENGKPNHLRLYSIASSAGGENFKKQTVSLCVRRLIYKDPVTTEEKRGLCSNYLCDLKKGDVVKVTGPVGKGFILPAEPPSNLILIATGTGIAPFRAFWRKLFIENKNLYQGKIHLFYGMPYSKDIYYKQELDELTSKHSNFEVHYSISREQKNNEGGKKYVHHLVEEKMNDIWSLLLNPTTSIYICGLKGMEKGLNEIFTKAFRTRGLDWDATLQKMKKEEKRWEVEVY